MLSGGEGTRSVFVPSEKFRPAMLRRGFMMLSRVMMCLRVSRCVWPACVTLCMRACPGRYLHCAWRTVGVPQAELPSGVGPLRAGRGCERGGRGMRNSKCHRETLHTPSTVLMITFSLSAAYWSCCKCCCVLLQVLASFWHVLATFWHVSCGWVCECTLCV